MWTNMSLVIHSISVSLYFLTKDKLTEWVSSESQTYNNMNLLAYTIMNKRAHEKLYISTVWTTLQLRLNLTCSELGVQMEWDCFLKEVTPRNPAGALY